MSEQMFEVPGERLRELRAAEAERDALREGLSNLRQAARGGRQTITHSAIIERLDSLLPTPPNKEQGEAR